jgi:hypothetical protein
MAVSCPPHRPESKTSTSIAASYFNSMNLWIFLGGNGPRPQRLQLMLAVVVLMINEDVPKISQAILSLFTCISSFLIG